LTALKLDGNRLTSLAGLGVLSALQHLSCAANQLIDCAGIAGDPSGCRPLQIVCLFQQALRPGAVPWLGLHAAASMC
jgi:hypothetical protein